MNATSVESSKMRDGKEEILEPVSLCADDGRLLRAAVGWSRRPLHRCNLRGHFGRKKKWDYWCVTDEKLLVALFVADLDYLALAALSALDLTTGRRFEKVALGACVLPEQAGFAPIVFDHFGLGLELGTTRLRARARGFSFEASVDPPGDSLNVVVPWDDDHFQFTSKQIGMPTRAEVQWGAQALRLDGFAALDFGRGIWPHRTRWNWAAGARGRLAFNLGGRWTDGTGATENGLFVSGRLHKIEDPVVFRDTGGGEFRIESAEVDLRFVPLQQRRLKLPFGLARLDWGAGRFHGRIRGEAVVDVFGWAEDFSAHW